MAILTAAISSVTAIFSQWYSGRQKLKEAELNKKIAIEENKARLARDKNQYNHDWEMASLEKSDRFLRRASFFLFICPFIVAIFSPELVNEYFSVALEPVPDWYKKIVVGMVGGIWGMSELKNILPSIASSIKGKKDV